MKMMKNFAAEILVLPNLLCIRSGTLSLTYILSEQIMRNSTKHSEGNDTIDGDFTGIIAAVLKDLGYAQFAISASKGAPPLSRTRATLIALALAANLRAD